MAGGAARQFCSRRKTNSLQNLAGFTSQLLAENSYRSLVLKTDKLCHISEHF
jgi:hypothetical protein